MEHSRIFNECDIEPFDLKIDAYLKDLEIINMEQGMRPQKASQLLGSGGLLGYLILKWDIN